MFFIIYASCLETKDNKAVMYGSFFTRVKDKKKIKKLREDLLSMDIIEYSCPKELIDGEWHTYPTYSIADWSRIIAKLESIECAEYHDIDVFLSESLKHFLEENE